MNPPLRTADDVQAMKEALKDGTIDVIATDHAPHTIDEKEVEYTQAPFGIVGLETCVGLCLSELIGNGVLTLMPMIDKLSTKPRAMLARRCILMLKTTRSNYPVLALSNASVVDKEAF